MTAIPAEELGVRALPSDASPAQRARAESVWRVMLDPAEPCRCSGTGCGHGRICGRQFTPDGVHRLSAACTGRLVHVDRQACGLFGPPVEWTDIYTCTRCGWEQTGEVTQPNLPWGELLPPHADGTFAGVRAYDGIRHIQIDQEADDSV